MVFSNRLRESFYGINLLALAIICIFTKIILAFMKHICFFLCLFTMAGSAPAQNKSKIMDLGNIVSDPGSVNGDLATRFGLGPVQESPAAVEIRLYSNAGFPGAQCVVLQYDKAWKAARYKLNAKDSAIRNVLKPSAGIDNIARSVMGANVFALPQQKNLNTGSYRLDLATGEVKPSAMTISDGACYIIQFKAGGNSREYTYCDPKAYAAFYKGQREYTDFVNVLKAFAKLEQK